MSLLLKNIIINDFIEEEFEHDMSLFIDYCTIERGLIKKYKSFLNVSSDKKKHIKKISLNTKLKNLNFFFFNKYKNNFTKVTRIISAIAYNFVSYIIVISFIQKNMTIHVMDAKGLLIVFCSTASSLKLPLAKRRRIQPKTISSLLKYFLKKVLYFNDEKYLVPVALHFKNVNKSYWASIVKKLKFKFRIKTISYFYCGPHNGCRPRKVRRVKQRRRKR